MAIIDTGLGWYCDERFFSDNTDHYIGRSDIMIGDQMTIRMRQTYKRVSDTSIPVICALDDIEGPFETLHLMTSIPPLVIESGDLEEYLNALSYWAQQSVRDRSQDYEYVENPVKCRPNPDNYIIFEYQGIDWIYYDGVKRRITRYSPDRDYGSEPFDMPTGVPSVHFHSDVITLEDRAIQILEDADVTVKPHYTIFFHNKDDVQISKKYGFIDEPVVLSDLDFEDPDAILGRSRGLSGWNTTPNVTDVLYPAESTPTNIAAAGETIDLYAVWWLDWAYLLGDRSGKIYTVVNNQRSQLTETTLTGELFGTKGFQFIPRSGLLVDLDKPTVYKWKCFESESPPEISAKIRAVPPVPQLVVFDNMSITKDIDYLVITANNNVVFNVSFDGGSTWKYRHNGAWTTVSTDGVGNSGRELEKLTTAAWADVSQLKFRCWVTESGTFQSILIVYQD